ncbi:MAG TPA: carbamoyl phosphate synthase large subunit, partial [Planctomycetaceae bacterium]|nr:carbamoyl phosphate synthase large subunit [Planctomycetaceae bacterium]
IMEHIEEAGIHSGDSACAIPPHSLPEKTIEEIRQATYALAEKLEVRGLMNIQYAVKEQDGNMDVYVLEVNPRASRTSPFVSKATGISLPRIAAKVMAGVSLKEQGVTSEVIPNHTSVKESVFPFSRFPGVDIVLGPEMLSTGEVMGISETFAEAFAKSQIAAGSIIPESGKIFISMAGQFKDRIIEPARRLSKLGYELVATSGTASALQAADVPVHVVRKVQEGRPNLLDYMANDEIAFIFNTPSKRGPSTDEGRIRAASVAYGVPCVTTLPGCLAVIDALEAFASNPTPKVRALQDWMADMNNSM